MPRCGVCGGSISRTVIPHGVICEDTRKANVMRHNPEIDDLIRNAEESEEHLIEVEIGAENE